ncbi:hypothetical protein [Amycolatopsis sp.]|nr:hypothetical protein [Amycolatopsis sp.]HVV14368.1 hypothetical protein [Amycolatopsis sp.]
MEEPTPVFEAVLQAARIAVEDYQAEVSEQPADAEAVMSGS